MRERYRQIFPAAILFSAGLIWIGFLLDEPGDTIAGLYRIVVSENILITDYVYIAGPGAALINSGIVTGISICILKFSGASFNGDTIVKMGLMSGFSLFGKNFFNIWPIILGSWLYAKYRKRPFSRYASVALLSTSLAPLVSYMTFGSIYASVPLGLLSGVVIGFVLPSLSSYTYKIQNGMNLYNMGFACGLLAMMIVPILTALDDKPESVLYWATGFNTAFAFVLMILCLIFILAGFFAQANQHGQCGQAIGGCYPPQGVLLAIICVCSEQAQFL